MKAFLYTALLVICIAVGGVGGYVVHDYQHPKEEAVVVEPKEDKPDLLLPTEVEKRVVTVEEVKGRIKEINEWSTI